MVRILEKEKDFPLKTYSNWEESRVLSVTTLNGIYHRYQIPFRRFQNLKEGINLPFTLNQFAICVFPIGNLICKKKELILVANATGWYQKLLLIFYFYTYMYFGETFFKFFKIDYLSGSTWEDEFRFFIYSNLKAKNAKSIFAWI